ncbi:MAG: tetratricopeptide repeat protein, partial [Planctomycetota bacterium]
LAQQIKPDCALCYYNIGNSLFARGGYKRAIRCWLRTAELEGNHPQIHYRIAQAYWSDGQIEQSREHFLTELRINPGDIDVIFDFGLFLLECGDIEAAKEKFNRILELDQDFAAALFYLGEIALNAGDNKRAAELYGRALEKDKTLQGPCFRLGQNALMEGRKGDAEDYLISEMKLALEDAAALVSMGSMFLKIGDLSCATHCLLRAVEIDCASADAYYYLGVISALKKEFEDAAELFTHSLDIRNEHVPALRDSAFVCLEMGKLDDAAERIKKARALDPCDPQLKELDHRITLARLKQRAINLIGRS